MADAAKKRKKRGGDPRLIVWAWGPLEADFWRYYRIDLTKEAMTNRLSWRRFLILLQGLPGDSAFARWINNREDRALAEWDESAVNAEFEGVV